MGVAVPLLLTGGAGVADEDQLLDPVLEGETPLVSEAVGEADCVLLALTLPLGVPVPLPLPLPLPLGVPAAVPVLDQLTEAVLEGDTPGGRLEVGLAVTVPLAVAVAQLLAEALLLALAVLEGRALPLPALLPLPLPLLLAAADCLAEGVLDWLALLLAELAAEGGVEAEGLAEEEGEPSAPVLEGLVE